MLYIFFYIAQHHLLYQPGISMHKGYAFVQFTNPFDARNACHGEDGRTILSQILGKFSAYIQDSMLYAISPIFLHIMFE